MRDEECFLAIEQKTEMLEKQVAEIRKLFQENMHYLTETALSIMTEINASTRHFTERQEALLSTIADNKQSGRGWIIQLLVVVCSILLSGFITFAGSILLFHLHP